MKTYDFENLNQEFETKPAEEIIGWAVGEFGSGFGMGVLSSFGVESAVLLHLATQVKPDIPDCFSPNTGFHFRANSRSIGTCW